MRCSACATENANSVKFCNECGAAFYRACPGCNAENPASAKFCGNCATLLVVGNPVPGPVLSDAPPAIGRPAVVPVVEGERKLVTALFADIKGSVELMVDLDVEDARAIVDPALRLMIDVVRAHEGYVVRSTGDGIYALFGAPIAYQDHPRRAVYAALAMQTALHSYAARLEEENRRPVIVRIGINTGEVVVRVLEAGVPMEYGGIGHTINLAARLQTAAAPGSVAIGELTAKLVEGYFELQPLPPMQVKGVAAPVNAYAVAGLSPLRRPLQIAMRRGLSKFVGRDSELRILRDAAERAAEGKGQIVATVTEAGTGKSRLLYEFIRTLSNSYRVLDAYAMAHGRGMPWMPVIDLLQGYFDIRPADEAARRRARIEAALAALDRSLLDATPYLFGLFGINEGVDPLAQMDSRVRRTRLIDIVVQIILAISRRDPLVLVFEDLHWADAQTRALLAVLAERIADARILLLATHRPDDDPAWRSKEYYTEIRLEPLSTEHAEELLASLLPDVDQMAPLKRSIIDKTAGNPFFIEEISHSLFEDGTLVHGITTRLTKPMSQLRLPQTVQDTLAERIDKLPSRHKDLLQILSVIGSRLAMELILGVCERMNVRLDGMLSDLQKAGFIYAQPDPGSVIYFFKHAFTQEVAYSSLLSERRKRLHELVAATMEAIYAETLTEHVSQLAHHYGRSANVPKAIAYLGLAGEVAIQRSAHVEGVESLNAALRLLETLPEGPERAGQESRYWLALGVSRQASLGYAASEVGIAYERAWQLGERAGDRRQLVSAIRGHSIYSVVRADYKTAFSLGARLADLDDEKQEYASERLMILGLVSLYTGHLRLGETYFQQALAPEHAKSDQEFIQYSGDSRALCLSYLAMNSWFLGYPDRAMRYAAEGFALGQSLSIPMSVAQTLGMYGVVAYARRDESVADEWMGRTIAYATVQGLPYWLTLGSILKSWLAVRRNRRAEDVGRFEGHLRAYRGSGARIGLPWLLSLRAEMFLANGQIGDALGAIDEALAVMQETNERYREAEILRLKGEFLLRQDKPGAEAAAEALFRQSVKIASAQDAKALELRAATSLARLWARQGAVQEGLDLLGPIHGWFTEGAETADLREAQGLLDDLARRRPMPFAKASVQPVACHGAGGN
jgi:class 3 adenylate cyclase/predicted ATPase